MSQGHSFDPATTRATDSQALDQVASYNKHDNDGYYERLRGLDHFGVKVWRNFENKMGSLVTALYQNHPRPASPKISSLAPGATLPDPGTDQDAHDTEKDWLTDHALSRYRLNHFDQLYLSANQPNSPLLTRDFSTRDAWSHKASRKAVNKVFSAKYRAVTDDFKDIMQHVISKATAYDSDDANIKFCFDKTIEAGSIVTKILERRKELLKELELWNVPGPKKQEPESDSEQSEVQPSIVDGIKTEGDESDWPDVQDDAQLKHLIDSLDIPMDM